MRNYVLCLLLFSLFVIFTSFFNLHDVIAAVPAIPTNVTVTNLNASSFRLNWTDNATDETAYYIQVNGSYVVGPSNPLPAGSTTWTATGYSCGVAFNNIYVIAVNGSGYGWSTPAKSTTLTCLAAPTHTSPANSTWVASRQFCATVTAPGTDSVYARFTINSVQYSGSSVSGTGSSCYTHTADLNNVAWYAQTIDSAGGASGFSSWYAKIDTSGPTPDPTTGVSGTATSQTAISASMNTATDSYSGLNSTPYGVSTNDSSYTWNASNSQTISSLTCGTSYTIYGKTRDTLGNMTTRGTSASVSTDACTPTAPTIGTATVTSQTTITVAWTDNSSNETGFRIYNASGGAQVGSASANATSGSASGLSCGTAYSFNVKAYVTSNGRTYLSTASSNTSSQTTDACTSGIPTIGTATATGQTTASLTWTRGSPYTETGFVIYTSGAVQVGTASAGATSGTASGLSCGTAYQFNVKSYITTNGRTYYSTASSNSNQITTTSCNNPPNTPTLVSPANNTWVTSRAFCATVSDPDGGNVTGKFVINSVTYTGSTVTSGSQSCYTHTADLNSVSWYAYAQDPSSATSGNTSSWTAKVDTVAPTPNPTTGVSASASSQTTISATQNAATDATSGLNSTPYGFSSNGSSYTWYSSRSSQSVTGLTCNTTYTIYGRSRDAAGLMTTAGSVSSITTDACTPTAPTIGTATPTSQTSMTVTWTDNSSNETGFIIYDSGAVQRGTASAGATSGSATGLTCNTSYQFNVKAYVTSNGRTYYSSASSNTSSQTTDACTPAVPTIGTATATGQTTASVTWTDNSSNETGFYIYTSGAVQVGSASAGATSGSATGLTCGTAYQFNVKAYVTSNGRTYYSSASSNSNQITTTSCDTTPPTPNPPTVSASAASQTSVSASMSAGSDAGVGLHSTPYGFSTNGSSYTWYSSNSQTLSSLTCNTSYTVYGKIRDALLNETSVGTTSVTTDACTPGVPTIGTATTTSGTAANVSWTRVAPLTETGFIIYDSGAVQRGTASAGATSGSATGLTCNTSYQFNVKAYVTSNGRTYYSSASSNSNQITTGSCVTEPADPVIIITEPDLGRPEVETTWSGTADGYLLYKYTTEDGYAFVGDVSSTSTNVTDLECPRNYTLVYFAYNIDTSLSGTVDSSCSELNAVSATYAANKRCSGRVDVPVEVKYCTHGFFGNY